ncbi:hypothetical protein IMCC21906_02922 [Spongiibacter sp. IMCC21906]|uniref:hypothetical protein n=1 Tax=Spongiibacter sp. IMCC21906 TaxID=1620392 RepID=UPI00062E00C6|nr:hypothetical protein [Spongiibacter sp. IMCC21906]AKH70562.1 hypothetical protein IMCC21906_02922 [Spongiibacter sp. IMCC21906]
MIIRGVKLQLITDGQDFGFLFTFDRKLTIVRAGNSCGKSTLVNTLLYGIGMEELLGGKGTKSLPYAVKDYIEHEGSKISISASAVWVEVENGAGEVVTFRRSIRDERRSEKLIEVFTAAHITDEEELGEAVSTYIHDAGSAKRQEGFHKYLEDFLGLSLPQVPTTGSGETKLYLQTVFAALAVEQKRGWTDYIATIPFFGIRDARTRVIEFLLNLDVFETNTERNKLNAESVEIDAEWRSTLKDLRVQAQNRGMSIVGCPAGPTVNFSGEEIAVVRAGGSPAPSLDDYMVQLREEYQALSDKDRETSRATGDDAISEIDSVTAELQRLNVFYERSTASHTLHQSSLAEYEKLLEEAQEDLERNKAASKLQTLGASLDVALASGQCPTCHQSVEDSLLAEAIAGPQMDLEVNIQYLKSQVRMLSRQITGLKEALRDSNARKSDLSAQVAAKYDYLTSLRKDMSSGETESKAVYRRQVKIEVEMESLEKLASSTLSAVDKFTGLALRLLENQKKRRNLPDKAYSSKDEERISIFEKQFRANAGSFGYESAPVRDIEISRDNLVPCLSQLELREIRRTDIKADSSASDFVRLIWSYLLALYQTSAQPSIPGNHPGMILFDEPGQHSMRAESQRALLQQLASESSLQSIVAASFDEMETVFKEVTSGVPHKLIEWSGKLIKPLDHY